MSQPWNAAPTGARPRSSGSRARKSSSGGQILLALLVGVIAAVAGGVIWAYIAKLTEREIGWVALGVGFLVGGALGLIGRSTNILLAAVGGLLAVAGCALGRVLETAFMVVAPAAGTSDFGGAIRMLQFPDESLQLLKSNLAAIDLLFVALAAVEAFVVTQRIGASRSEASSDDAPRAVSYPGPPAPAPGYGSPAGGTGYGPQGYNGAGGYATSGAGAGYGPPADPWAQPDRGAAPPPPPPPPPYEPR